MNIDIMSSILSSGYNKNPEQIPLLQLNRQLSPLKKHLPVIYENHSPQWQHQQAHHYDHIIQLHSPVKRFQSRLIAQQMINNSAESMSNSENVPGQKQRQLLLGKIYKKQKQLVLLQDKLYMLKNTNECLRDTIMEEQIEKNKLLQQLERTKIDSRKQKEIIANFQIELQEVKEQLSLKLTDQEKYYSENNILSKSKTSLLQQNASLQLEIQQIRAMYEQEIGIMEKRNQQMIIQIQQKFHMIIKQKDYKIKEMETKLEEKEQQIDQKQQLMAKERQLHLAKIQSLQREIQNIKKQNKLILKDSAVKVQQMKEQITILKREREQLMQERLYCQRDQTMIRNKDNNVNTYQVQYNKRQTHQSLPLSENILIHPEESFQQQQDRNNQEQRKQSTLINHSMAVNDNPHFSYDQAGLKHTINTSYQKIQMLQKENTALKNIISHNFNQQQDKLHAQIQLNTSRGPNHPYQQTLSKNNSIASLKPTRGLNYSYLNDQLNQTLSYYNPERLNLFNNNNNSYCQYNRSPSKSRSRSKPKHSTINYPYHMNRQPLTPNLLAKPGYHYTSSASLLSPTKPHFNIPSPTQTFNSQLYKDIDTKLDQIKHQINKQINY